MHALLGNLHEHETRLPQKDSAANLTRFLHITESLATYKKHDLPKQGCRSQTINVLELYAPNLLFFHVDVEGHLLNHFH